MGLYAFLSLLLLPVFLRKVRLLCARVLLVAPNWPQRSWMADVHEKPEHYLWWLPVRWDMLSQVQGRIWHQEPQTPRLHAWPLKGSICALGLDMEVVDMLQASRPPSTQLRFSVQQRVYRNWCHAKREDPFNCHISVIISFLNGLGRA